MTTETSGKVKCPVCGNLLGIVENGELIVKKKGRTVILRVWEEAEVECENCRGKAEVYRREFGRRGVWDGMVDSRGKSAE